MTRRAPSWLPLSAQTDIALLLADLKPAARIHAGSRRLELRRWARRNGLFASSDPMGFVVLARQGMIARRVLDVDRRPGRHTIALGRLLGYPECCCRAAGRVGDEGIDDLQAAMALRRFRGRFELINPGDYLDGKARLSHVPCSHNCAASLALALRSVAC